MTRRRIGRGRVGKEGGWSLIELMAALAAFIPMMLGLLYLFQGAMEVFVSGTNRLQMLQNERAIVDLVAQHLRPAIYMNNAIPVDDADVGAGKGRNYFGFLGQDDATTAMGEADDFLGWYYVGYHTVEDQADGGDIQYAQIHAAKYDAMAGYNDERALKFLTGASSGNSAKKSTDLNPLPATGMPPASAPATADASPNWTTPETRLIDDLDLLDLDYTSDTSPTNWVDAWNAQTSGRLPRFVRLSVRIMTPDPDDAFAISTIVYLPLADDTAPWPGGVRP